MNNGNIFGNLATDMQAMLKQNPMANQATQNNGGIFGLGGQNTGLIDKFSNIANGMFGGQTQGTAAPQKLAEGGTVGDGTNPFKAQYDDINGKYAAMLGQYNQTTDETAKSQLATTMTKLKEAGMKLAQQMQQWDQQQKSNVTGGEQVTPPGGEGQSMPGAGTGATDLPKARRIIIEEKPHQ
jgi:hypothetical protein